MVFLTRNVFSASFERYRPALLVCGVVSALVAAWYGSGEDFRLFGSAVVVGFAIVSWTFGLLAEPLTTLLFFLLVVTFGIAEPDVVFSGFAAGAWWLLLGGSIIAMAVETTGLGRRLADLVFNRWALTYSGAVSAVAFSAVCLTFLMPSAMGRTLLLIPVVRSFAGTLGLTPERRGYTGLILTAAAASYMPSTAVLPANIPNTILLGAADALYGIKLTYGPYLLLHFPVLGFLKTIALIWLVCRMFPDHEPLKPMLTGSPKPMSQPERRLSFILGLSLALYATDSIHGISPAWITLGAGILCLLPPFSVLTPKMVAEKANVVTLLYIAGILGLSAVVVDAGLSRVISLRMLDVIELSPGQTISNVMSLSAIGIVLTMLTTATGVPAVLAPLAGDFAAATGLPVTTVLMLNVIAFSTVLLPYVSPPMMVWLQMSGVGIRAATKLCLALGAVTVFVLFPIDYLWWDLLGYFR